MNTYTKEMIEQLKEVVKPVIGMRVAVYTAKGVYTAATIVEIEPKQNAADRQSVILSFNLQDRHSMWLDGGLWLLPIAEQPELKAQISIIRNGHFSVADLQAWFSREALASYPATWCSELRSAIGAAYRQHRDLQDRTAAAGNLTFAKTEETLANALQVAFTNLHERAGSEDPAQAEIQITSPQLVNMSTERLREVMADHRSYTESSLEIVAAELTWRTGKAPAGDHEKASAGMRCGTCGQYGDNCTGTRWLDRPAMIEVQAVVDGELDGQPYMMPAADFDQEQARVAEITGGNCSIVQVDRAAEKALGMDEVVIIEELRSEKELRQATELTAPLRPDDIFRMHPADCSCSICGRAEAPGMNHAHLLPDNHFLHVRDTMAGLEIQLARYEDGALGTGRALTGLATQVIDWGFDDYVVGDSLGVIITNLRRELIQQDLRSEVAA